MSTPATLAAQVVITWHFGVSVVGDAQECWPLLSPHGGGMLVIARRMTLPRNDHHVPRSHVDFPVTPEDADLHRYTKAGELRYGLLPIDPWGMTCPVAFPGLPPLGDTGSGA